MIVDTSALLAVLFDEVDKGDFLRAMAEAASLEISGGNWLELTTVLVRRGHPDLIVPAERLRATFAIQVAPVSPQQIEAARTAYQRFGKGQHPAHLNFGDCFAYALAKETGEPLLFKGDDFTHTDMRPAI